MLRFLFICLLLASPALANTLPDTQIDGGTNAPADPNPMSVAPEVGASDLAVAQSLRPKSRRFVVPAARWDRNGGNRGWTMTALSALRSHASALPEVVPRDIADWCPAYPTATRAQREAFWVGLVSTIVKHESTYRPTAVGGGGLWYGLMQILPGTARGYKCQARSGEALKDPHLNLSCALRIMARTVPRDGVVSRGMRGVAADWGPFHSRRKRQDMMAWTRTQSYCQGLSRSLRPVARPAGLDGAIAQEPPFLPEGIGELVQSD